MKKILFLQIILSFSFYLLNAQNCNNWLNTPSVSSAVNIGDLDIPGDKVTVEATINRTQPYVSGGLDNSEGDVVSKHNTPSDVNYLLRPNHAYITTTNGFFGTPDICDLELNKTYHVALVYDGSTLKFYRDGFLMSQVNATGNLIQNNWNTRIGHYDPDFWGTQFIGYTNEVRIWNIARSQAQIKTYMNVSLPSPTSQVGLLAYYTFDDLVNKQGNVIFNGALNGNATIRATNSSCAFVADSCNSVLTACAIDSIKITDSAISCVHFDFKGIGFTKSLPITQWQWDFGDAATANTQNTTHTYSIPGSYMVKLIATDINGCRDSISKTVTGNGGSDFDFSYKQDICNPLSIQFFNIGTAPVTPSWLFGDGSSVVDNASPTHLYASPGTYIVKYSVQNGGCFDTITKNIAVNILNRDVILTRDTTICFKNTKQLLTLPSLSFCWSPTTFLDDPTSPNPVSSSPQTITYFFTAELPGSNMITNGDFNSGNTGFTSQYNFANPNITEGQYFVSINPQAWNASLSSCPDHTTGNGNMMLVNGAPIADVNVWAQTVTVVPNTNYAFSTWIQALYPPNPAQLSFSINGGTLGSLITASLPTCTWEQFYTTWNSGNNTSAAISIVNKNTFVQGNDFALDDISFSPVLIQRDSVKITIDTPLVRTVADTATCGGKPVQLNATGATSYNWLPSTGLTNPGIANPVATPADNTQYIVTGTNASGCTANDTVNVFIKPQPVITKSGDSTICRNKSIQLFASGGTSYSWSPAATLNDPAIATPTASPAINTSYLVTVTGTNSCTRTDSVKIAVQTPPVFSISPDKATCLDNAALSAGGGNSYLWSPAALVDNPNISNPVSNANTTTTFTVKIKDNTCNDSTTLTTTVTILQALSVTAFKSNDIDCVLSSAQLTAGGGNQYVWSPATGLDNSNIANPLASITAPQQYLVTATDTVTNCTGKATVTVFIKGVIDPEFYVPNAFSPNGDGRNDCFGVKHFGTVKSVDISIYNRWGNLVFHTSNVNDCWDGTFKGLPANTGNYVYFIKSFNDCGEKVKRGNLMLVR